MSGIQLTTNGTIIFEGSSNDDNETTLTVTNPTADRTITIPNETGTLITSNGIDVISESMMADQAISSVQMKTLSTLQILNSAGTVVKTIHGAGV
jgi:hypothetical protein